MAEHPSQQWPSEPQTPSAEDLAAEQAYIESLIASGQAAKPDADGKLPPGATHEIVQDPDGRMHVVRRRFSAY